MPASETRDGTEKAASEPANPGGRLREAREAQGLQIEEVANELRISASALAALEDNRFDALGAAVFARGYLKQYGARLGLDPRDLLARYERAVGESEIALAPTKGIRLRDERQISLWIVSAFALVLIVGGLSWWWWRQAEIDLTPTSADSERNAEASTPAETGVDEADSAAPALAAELKPLSDPVAELAPEPEPAVESETALATTRSPELPAAVDDPAPEPAPQPTEANAQASLASAVESPAVADGPVLEVIFIEDSWAEISDGEGSRLFRDLGRAGTQTRLPADRNLNIYLGNASGVVLRLDGEPVPIPGAGRRDVVRFELDDVID